MRKVLLIGASAVLSAAMTVGVIFAQNSAAQPWLGIRVAENNNQVVITQVQAGSPAADANLMVDDVIVTFNADPITSTAELAKDIQAATVGESVAVDVLRASSSLTVDVTLGASPSAAAAPQTVPGSRNNPNGALALDPLNFTERLLQANLSEVDNGYQVTAVIDTFNPFGLQVDDIVTSLNGQDIKSLDLNTLRSDLQSSASPSLSLNVLRGGVATTLDAGLTFGGFGGGDDDGGQFGGDGNVPGQFNRPGRGDFGGDNNFGDDDNFGGDDGGNAPQTQPQTTPPPISLGNA